MRGGSGDQSSSNAGSIKVDSKENSDSKAGGESGMSTDITPEKINAQPASSGTDDISPEGLLEVISQEWKNENDRIKTMGLNGFKRRKENRNECLV
jgi:hypothetical protein